MHGARTKVIHSQSYKHRRVLSASPPFTLRYTTVGTALQSDVCTMLTMYFEGGRGLPLACDITLLVPHITTL